ncbi:hypothetical protein [Psychroserpens mesophilus]|uniref:hypothetical protein n=1 Tax=Psychroserpens mesophilus TaxID=325473 RepID=UPI00058DEA99|nr:hypothetical protein [Psychroserpens mesophilus]
MYVKTKILKTDIWVLISIMILPFIFFIYNVAPIEISIWKTNWFEIDSGFYKSVEYYFWILSVKFLTLSILSIWFLTCLHRWRLIILIPIYVEIYKICVNFYVVDYGFKHEFDFPNSFLISIPFSIFLLLLSRRLGYNKRFHRLKINDEISNEMLKTSMIHPKVYSKIKKELSDLNKEKEGISKKDYLIKLIALRDQISI